MQILLTNDDGIYAPGLAAMERELRSLGEVCLVAPAVEQSGVGHSITYLTPLIVEEVYDGDRLRGWACQGSPADCVKIGVAEFCNQRPALVVSGINNGLNAGINVLYSGTVAAAIEGAFFGITSVAVSLEHDAHAHFDAAARLARGVIEQIIERRQEGGRLYNLNIPTRAVEAGAGQGATESPGEVHVVPMGLARYGERFQRRSDPRGRSYFWATSDPPPQPESRETDLSALQKGHVTLTPLDYDMTRNDLVEEMQQWGVRAPN